MRKKTFLIIEFECVVEHIFLFLYPLSKFDLRIINNSITIGWSKILHNRIFDSIWNIQHLEKNSRLDIDCFIYLSDMSVYDSIKQEKIVM